MYFLFDNCFYMSNKHFQISKPGEKMSISHLQAFTISKSYSNFEASLNQSFFSISLSLLLHCFAFSHNITTLSLSLSALSFSNCFSLYLSLSLSFSLSFSLLLPEMYQKWHICLNAFICENWIFEVFILSMKGKKLSKK